MKSPLKIWSVLGIALLVSTSLIACSSSDDGSSGSASGGGGSTLKIAAVAPQTGDIGAIGTSQIEGAKLAVKEANESDFLGDGTTIEMVEEDSAGDPAQAIAKMQKVISDGAIVVLGGTLTPEAAVMKPRAIEAQVPFILLSSLRPDIPEPPYVYRQIPLGSAPNGPNEQVSKAMAEQGVETAVITVTGDNDGQVSDAKSWEEQLKAAGVEVLGTVAVNAGETNLSGAAAEVVDQDPDLVINSLLAGGQSALMVKALADQGYTGRTAAYQSLSLPADYEVAGEDLEGVVVATPFATTSDYPITADFVKAWEDEHGDAPTIIDAMGYEAVRLAVLGFKNADDPTSRESVTEALSKVKDVESVYGPAEYIDGQLQLSGELPFLVWEADGSLVSWR